MRRFFSMLSFAAVSLPGLAFFNCLVLAILGRFLIRIVPQLVDGTFSNPEQFMHFGGAASVRMIAVGVLILERQEILEMAGLAPHNAKKDSLSESAHPYGIYYLCFGLVMECLIEQVRIPWSFVNGLTFDLIILGLSLLISLVGLVACLSLFAIFWREYRRP